MLLTRHSCFALALRASAATLLVLGTLILLGHSAKGAAISDFAFGEGGDPKTAPYPNPASDFFRWEHAPLTYAFDPSFTAVYGSAGRSEVNKAFATWAASITADDTAPLDQSDVFGGTDVSVLGLGGNVDLQSVALHEIGHAIAFDHPNFDSGNEANNYNVVAGDWVQADLPAGSHPIMWDPFALNISRQQLTLDDIRVAQFLYSTNSPGAGMGDAGGPVFGNSAVALSFSDITGTGGSPDILFKGANTPGLVASITNTLGFSNGGDELFYTIAINATAMVITIGVPEPSSLVLLSLGVLIISAVAWRRRVRRS